MGSAIFVSISILHIRKRAFEKKLEELAARKRKQRPGRVLTFSLSRRRGSTTGTQNEQAIASGAVRGKAIEENANRSAQPDGLEYKDNTSSDLSGSDHHNLPPLDTGHASAISRSDSVADRQEKLEPSDCHVNSVRRTNERIKFDDAPSPRSPTGLTSPVQSIKRTRTRLFDVSGVGVRGLENHPRNALPFQAFPPVSRSEEVAIKEDDSDLKDRRAGSFSGIDKYLKTLNGYTGRNSQFHNLTEKERRRLGGIEYDAVCLLSYVVPMYFVLWQLIGAVGMGAWFTINRPGTTLANGELKDVSDAATRDD